MLHQDCMGVISVVRKNHKNVNELFEDVDNLLSPKPFVLSKKSKLNEFQDKTSIYFDLIDKLHKILCIQDDIAITIDVDFQIITVTCKDSLGSMQYMKLKMLQNGNYVAYDYSLPEVDNLGSQFIDVQQAVNVFKECLSDLSEYFETMADLDGCCWIIDPSIPTSKDNFRRIVIGDNVSILVTVDYKSTRDMPHISVLGPTAAVDALSHKIHLYADRWNTDLNLTLNLLNILDMIEFPSKPMDDCATEQPMEVECGICISSRDDFGCLPDIVCGNTNYCSQNFHTGCLYQWLSTVAGNVQIFDTIHGKCPSCLSSISCAVVELT